MQFYDIVVGEKGLPKIRLAEADAVLLEEEFRGPAAKRE